jgi:hypothetical protein
MRFLPIFLIFSLSEIIVAETSEQYVVRSEFMFCKYNEGKGYNDVVEQSKQYQKFLEEKGLKYTRYVMTPIWAGEQEYDYILSGNWPDGQEQYREWGAYLNEYPQWLAEQDIDVSQAGTCSASVSMRNHAVMRIRINQDDYDRINFVDLRNCNFTENASMSDLKTFYVEYERANRDFGREGFGINLFTPYRGFDTDINFDFVNMTYWYNAEKRSEMIASYREWNDFITKTNLPEERQSLIEGCSPPKTWASEWIFSTGR